MPVCNKDVALEKRKEEAEMQREAASTGEQIYIVANLVKTCGCIPPSREINTSGSSVVS